MQSKWTGTQPANVRRSGINTDLRFKITIAGITMTILKFTMPTPYIVKEKGAPQNGWKVVSNMTVQFNSKELIVDWGTGSGVWIRDKKQKLLLPKERGMDDLAVHLTTYLSHETAKKYDLGRFKFDCLCLNDDPEQMMDTGRSITRDGGHPPECPVSGKQIECLGFMQFTPWICAGTAGTGFQATPRTGKKEVEKSGVCSRGGDCGMMHVFDAIVGTVVLWKPSMTYIAISYVWENLEKYELDGQIRKAAEACGVRYVWVDQKCMDQPCTKDKELQVPAMRHIFADASKVIVLIPEITAVVPENYRNREGVWKTTELRANTAEYVEQMKKCSWFTRIWTWQEGLVAKSGAYMTATQLIEGWVSDNIIAAHQHVSTDYVSHEPGYALASNVTSLGVKLRPLAQLVSMRWLAPDDAADDHESWVVAHSAPRTLSTLLVQTINRSCTKPGDRIYGLMGLLIGAPNIDVVYNGITLREIVEKVGMAGGLTSDFLLSSTKDEKEGYCWMPKKLYDFNPALARVDPSTTRKIQFVGDKCQIMTSVETGKVFRESRADMTTYVVKRKGSNIATLIEGADLEGKAVHLALIADKGFGDLRTYVVLERIKKNEYSRKPGVIAVEAIDVKSVRRNTIPELISIE